MTCPMEGDSGSGLVWYTKKRFGDCMPYPERMFTVFRNGDHVKKCGIEIVMSE